MTQTGHAEIEQACPEPRRGTKDWILAQPLVDWDGVLVPDCHRLPDGATFEPGDDDGFCRVIIPGRGRCRATRIRGMRLCSAHAGGGDPQAAAALATEARVRLKERRMLLGIGTSRVGNPRQQARLRALERADDIARALVDDVLDGDLGPVERQLAVVRALDSTFPLQSASIEVELPADAVGVQAMGWEQMQQLAARLLVEPEAIEA